ncbi:hypothetical protein PYCCODRAFT_320373 [Trametes coccinea BRFM310]|uniref:Uncharacterized protein n=1 Tax=Trametes coccinea (strain BRFM310) TaxID=1353009 RepID=A0A1Y2IN83_TRAC3|nr:hypothetical protein PYCCODRAFT_320373 [Trametes coccinea BRFM310]
MPKRSARKRRLARPSSRSSSARTTRKRMKRTRMTKKMWRLLPSRSRRRAVASERHRPQSRPERRWRRRWMRTSTTSWRTAMEKGT